MKWFILIYVVVLTILYILFYLFKKKKNNFFNKIFFISFCFCNALFLIILGVCYQIAYEERFTLRKEHENLVMMHEYIEELFLSVSENSLNGLQEKVESIESEISTLEQNQQKISSEIKNLQNQYILILKLKNEVENTTYEEYQIPNFPTYDQRMYYPNGCESVSLYLLLKYNGVDVSPEQIVNTLKKGDTPHMEGNVKYGGDPEVEFVGNPKDKSGYGVYENPIIDVANQFKSGIKKITGTTLTDVLKIVEQGHPVQVWASSYQRTPTKCNTWIHKESGKTITWYCNFHSLVLIGYTGNKVVVSDPLTGTIVKYDRTKFDAAYNFYGRRAIYYE